MDSAAVNGVWAPNHAYTAGQIVQGITGGQGNGHLHRCIVGGTSGGAEPVWTDIHNVSGTYPTYEFSDGVMTAGSPNLNCSSATDFSNMTTAGTVGQGIFVIGAGAAGGTLYSTIVSVTGGSQIVLADNASTNVSGARFVMGHITVDNSAQWIQDEFLEAWFNSSSSVRNCSFRWGQIRTHFTWRSVITQCNFARSDYLYQAPFGTTPQQGALYPMVVSYDGKVKTSNRLTLNGGYNDGVASTELAPPVRAVDLAQSGTINTDMSVSVQRITPNGACTINATGGNSGERVTFVILTSGGSSYNITFGTGFFSSGVLATGVTTAKYWTVEFVCKTGSPIWVETARSGPI